MASIVDAVLRRAGRHCGPLIARTVDEMRQIRRAMDLVTIGQRGVHPTVGFVPTMGALHAGHLALCARARERGPGSAPTDFVVASVFVNPTQFAPHEDLGAYPRTWEADLVQLDTLGVDAVFHPSAQELYPPSAPQRAFVDLSGFDTSTPEGAARPGFFRGVATVVTKLMSIVEPTHAVFGQKDGMQCIAVRQLVRDLNLSARVDVVPTLRAPDGLALSSRNAYLSPDERRLAPAIHAALLRVRDHIQSSAEGTERLARAAAAVATRQQRAASWTAAEAEGVAQRAAQASRIGSAGAGPAIAGAAAPKEDAYLAWLREWASQAILAEVRSAGASGRALNASP